MGGVMLTISLVQHRMHKKFAEKQMGGGYDFQG